MRVLMPATHYYPVIGGIENWTRNIAEGLSQKAEIFVVTGKVKNQPKREELNGVKIWRTSFFTLANLSASPLIYSISLLPFIFFKSLDLIKKEKVNILHCQGFLSSFLGYCLSRIARIPYVVTVQRLEFTRNPLKNFIYRKADFCIAASKAVRENFEKAGAKNIEIIPNGIDLKKFENLEQKPHGGFVVITVARLEKVKGVEYLIRAMAKFCQYRVPPDLAVLGTDKLVIIGNGSERKNLENLAKELNLEEKVEFLGEIPNEEIPSHLTGADCFVLPSLREGFGIAILEALAVGLPVIGTNVGGIKDIVENGKTGILVEPANPEAIALAIERIYSGEKFTKADLGKYNWENISQEVFNVYQKCLS